MSRRERESSSWRRRRRSPSPSDSDDTSDSSGSPSPCRSQSRHCRGSLRKTTPSSSSDASDSLASGSGSDSGGHRRKRSSSGKCGGVIEEQIMEYMSKKAQKKAEIEKVKKRREERAIEKAQHEEEMYSQVKGKNDEEDGRINFTLRNAPQPQTSDLPTYVFAHIGNTFPVSSKAWELATATLSLRTMATLKTILAHFRTPGMQKFHFDQSKFRSEIRLREGRTKPIDVLLKNLNFADEEKEALKKLKAEERLARS